MMTQTVKTKSYPVSIFIAGDITQIEAACQGYCDSEGYCVTVTPTNYIFTGGHEEGAIIGLINYGRFPAEPETILARSRKIADQLLNLVGGQESCSIQSPDSTIWLSRRDFL